MNLFYHFWLDPKVSKRSRLRALRTPSRRLQVGKSGNSLRFGQPDFLSACSLLRRLTARGRRTNAEAFEARFLTTFGMTRGGVRNDKETSESMVGFIPFFSQGLVFSDYEPGI